MTRLSPIAVVCGIVLNLAVSSGADIINPGQKVVARCASVCNADSFPNVVLVGAIVWGGTTRYIIKQDSCLTKGYKFSRFYVIWTTKAYFDSVGLDGLPLESVIGTAKSTSLPVAAPVYLLSSTVEPYGGTVPVTNPLASEELHYSLANTGGALSIYLSKKVSIATDGARTVEYYTNAVKPRQLDRRGGDLLRGAPRTHGFYAFSTDFTGSLMASITDCAGRTVRTETFACTPGATYAFSFGNLHAGIYWLRMRTPNGAFTGMIRQLN